MAVVLMQREDASRMHIEACIDLRERERETETERERDGNRIDIVSQYKLSRALSLRAIKRALNSALIEL